MNRLFWIIVLGFLSPLLVAGGKDEQVAKRERELATMPDDTAKVNALIELGKYYCSQQNDRSLLYLQQALALSTELGYTRGTGRSYLWQARSYYYKDEYALAHSYLERAREPVEKGLDQRDLAFWHFAKASLEDINGNFNLAFKEYQETIRLTMITGDESLRATSLVSLGSISTRMRDPVNALHYFRQALTLQEKNDEQPGIANTCTSIGAAYESDGHPDSALYYFRKGYQIRLSEGNTRAIANSEYSLGSLFTTMERYPEAIGLLEKAKERYQLMDEKAGACMVDLRLAAALDGSGKKEQARKLALQALAVSRGLGNLEMTAKCYQALADLAATNRQFQDAYQYTKQANGIIDTLSQQKRERVIKEMEVKFRIQEVSSEMNNLLLRERAHRKNIILLSISLAALLAALILTILLYRQKVKMHKREKKIFDQERIIGEQRDALTEKEKQLLLEKVETQERELAAKALEMLRINETLGNIIGRLLHLDHRTISRQDLEEEIGRIVHDIEHHTQQNAWQEFDTIFRNIHREFYERLLEKCPDLTASEIKIAALLKLNLSTKEIAAITLKSEEGIKSTRYRLRKKLNFTSDEHLIPFLMQL